MLGRLLERREFTPNPDGVFGRGIPSNGQLHMGSDAGEIVGEHQALRLIAVQACVRLLADSIASLPIDVYRKEGDARVELSPPPVITDPHPLVDMTAVDWRTQVVTSLALRGNSYNVVTSRDALERPTALLPIHPDNVMIEPHEDERTGRRWYKVGGERVSPRDMFHIRALLLPGAFEGLSPIGYAKQAIGLGLAAERFGARWFGDGAAPSSILWTEQELTEEQRERNMKAWVATHGGRRYPALLEGGMNWKPVTIMPNESQFLETRKFAVSEIARLFGVPPHMIGDVDRSTSWGSGIEEQSMGFVTYHLRPWLVRIEAALDQLLPRGQFVKFNLEGLLRGATKDRYDAYTQARNAGWMNVDEIRAKEDLEPLPDGLGQDYLQPLNMGPLGSDPLAAKNGADSDGDD